MDYLPPYISTAVISNPPGRGLIPMGIEATAGADGPMLTVPGRGTLQGVRFTAHPRGGGYIGFLQILDGKKWSPNLVQYRFGRGIQPTIRDDTPWNPNLGGFREAVGTPARILKTPTSLIVNPLRVALFQNQEFDFTERENEAPDDFPNDQGRDDDQLNDAAAGLSNQYAEVMSEAAFAGRYDRQPTVNGTPAVRFRYHFAYRWPFGAMKQFRTGARTEDGVNWTNDLIANGFAYEDWSGVNMSMGFRMTDVPGWTFTHYSVGGTLALKPTPRSGEERVRTYVGAGEDLNIQDPLRADGTPLGHQRKFKNTEQGLVLGIMATSANPNTARAIGLYMPRTTTNRAQVVTPTGQENRRLSSAFLFVRDGEEPPGSNMVLRTVYSGMRQGDALFADVVFLFGSPNEILAAARHMEVNP